MEDQFFTSYSGQEVQTSDLDTIAKDAALADDRVFAELLRMVPYNGSTVTKGILPYSSTDDQSGATVVAGSVGSGSVTIRPCRVFIGSTTAEATDALDNWKGVRSVVYTGSPTSLTATQSFAANASGNARWDLIYFRVDKDANASTVTRYVKTAGPPVLETPTSMAVIKNTKVIVGVVTGTPSATPTYPAIPSDSGGSYYVSAAFVRIPNGFGPTSTVLNTDIQDCTPTLKLSKSTAAVTMRPATAMNDVNGAVLTKVTAGGADWAATGSRPTTFMPPSMKGAETLMIALDCQSATSSSWSQPDGSILDNSVDWRNRIFSCMVASGGGSTLHYVWESTGISFFPEFGNPPGSSSPISVGIGQSFQDEGGGKGNVIALTNSNSLVASSQSLRIYVDLSDGTMRFTTDGTLPAVKIFALITASAPFTNNNG